jgi:hypothetical protein
MVNPKFLFLFIFSTLLFACVEPFEINLNTKDKILFIEADLNNIDDNQSITLQYNFPSNSSIEYVGIDNAKVTVIENGSNIISCSFSSEGTYLLPTKFKTKIGAEYQLHFTLADGSEYKSSIETSQDVPPISNVYSRFVSKSIAWEQSMLDGHEIFIDTKDNPTEGDFYLWQWKMYEKESYCISCQGGKYYNNPLPLGVCIDDANLKRRNITYDYQCSGDCWDIIFSNKVNIMSDIYTNSGEIKNRLVAEIPFFQFKECVVEIQQFSISKSAFDYFNLIIQQNQNNGSLADTPPAGLIGNIKNINNSVEAVGGFFVVASKTTYNYWLKRDDYANGTVPYGTLNGRAPSPELAGADTSRPPFAPCIESKTRTAVKPQGWLK